jgi:Family of unknown function (DUF5759)
MSNIFTLENFDNFSEKLNIDELYDRKKKHDQQELELYNKILNRVHVRIKTTSNQRTDQQICWYLVPEIIIGVPSYNQANCIAYLITKLKSNGFRVRYVDPNLLMITWAHIIPSYVRTEYKKKFGKTIDEFGNEVEEKQTNNSSNYLMEGLTNTNQVKVAKKYNSTSTYKPSGKLL